MRVVAATSILNYLILLGQLDLVPTLYERIVVSAVGLTIAFPPSALLHRYAPGHKTCVPCRSG